MYIEWNPGWGYLAANSPVKMLNKMYDTNIGAATKALHRCL